MATKRDKTIIICSIIIILAVVLILGFIKWKAFRPQVDAANSIQKIDDGVYTMTFKGDYGFHKFLENGGASTDEDMVKYIIRHFGGKCISHSYAYSCNKGCTNGCSVLTISSDEGPMMARNYDWNNGGNILIVRAYPENGYASISTCTLDLLGMGTKWAPEGKLANRMKALAALYIPLDGVNEKGVAVAELFDLNGEPANQVSKDSSIEGDITTLPAIRMILDYASTTDEAIALLKKFNMHSSINHAHHFAINDLTGNSVVVEYVGNEMKVTPATFCTNHDLYIMNTTGKQPSEDIEGISSSIARYSKLSEVDTSDPEESIGIAIQTLRDVSFPEWTQWSVILNQQERTTTYFMRSNFNKKFKFDF